MPSYSVKYKRVFVCPNILIPMQSPKIVAHTTSVCFWPSLWGLWWVWAW